MLSPSFLDDLRARVSISAVIGRRVKLVKAGRGESKGLCPFHHERSPSFTVSEDKGLYHCFGCQASGDVIGFVQATHGLEFLEAVERLAEEAGLSVPRAAPRDAEAEQRRLTLAEAVEVAANAFHQMLYRDIGRAALAYLRRRGLDDETIARWRLGYAPPDGTLLLTLRRAGVPDAAMIEAGLARVFEDGPQRRVVPFFRERVTIPITDRQGRVVGFGARAMGDAQPKYLNSPDGPLFRKGELLFGWHTAAPAARQAGRVIVVEGYMDVIAMAQAGIAEAVAPLGTAVGETQLGLLWRLCAEPLVCLDGDKAGRQAALRTAERALPLLGGAQGLRFATVVGGKDPDELVRSAGRPALEAVLAAAEPLEAVLWRGLAERFPAGSAAMRAALTAEAEVLVDRVPDPHARESLREALAARLARSARPAAATTRAAGRLAVTLRDLGRLPAPASSRAERRAAAILRRAVEDLSPRALDWLESQGAALPSLLRAGCVGLAWVREAERGRFEPGLPRLQTGVFAAYVHPVLAAPLAWPACESDAPPAEDLVAWDPREPSRVLTLSGSAVWLGAAAVARARLQGGPLHLHATPLAWLADGCRGAVWLRPHATAAGVDSLRAALSGVRELVFADRAHAAAVEKALKARVRFEMPRMRELVRRDDGAAAAA